MKRFYKKAEAAETDGGFVIHLDGRPVKTPAGRLLDLGSHGALALEIAHEWDAQVETVRPHAMPLTQLAATALDRVGPERPAIIAQMVAYAKTDLLCYRADAPQGLVERQHQAWQPVLDRIAVELGAAFRVTSGIMAVDQPDETLATVQSELEALDAWRLTGAQATAAAAGSTILALALVLGHISGEEVFALSQVDETWQMEFWGVDYEAKDRRDALEKDIRAAARLLDLISTA